MSALVAEQNVVVDLGQGEVAAMAGLKQAAIQSCKICGDQSLVADTDEVGVLQLGGVKQLHSTLLLALLDGCMEHAVSHVAVDLIPHVTGVTALDAQHALLPLVKWCIKHGGLVCRMLASQALQPPTATQALLNDRDSHWHCMGWHRLLAIGQLTCC